MLEYLFSYNNIKAYNLMVEWFFDREFVEDQIFLGLIKRCSESWSLINVNYKNKTKKFYN